MKTINNKNLITDTSLDWAIKVYKSNIVSPIYTW